MTDQDRVLKLIFADSFKLCTGGLDFIDIVKIDKVSAMLTYEDMDYVRHEVVIPLPHRVNLYNPKVMDACLLVVGDGEED